MCEYIHVNPIFFWTFWISYMNFSYKNYQNFMVAYFNLPLEFNFSIEYVNMQDRYVDMQHDIP